MKLLRVISVGFNATDQLLTRPVAFVRYWRKNASTKRQYISSFVDFKKACDSVRRKVLYNVLIEFGVSVKVVRPIKMRMRHIVTSV
jgi:hypothetical protein